MHKIIAIHFHLNDSQPNDELGTQTVSVSTGTNIGFVAVNPLEKRQQRPAHT